MATSSYINCLTSLTLALFMESHEGQRSCLFFLSVVFLWPSHLWRGRGEGTELKRSWKSWETIGGEKWGMCADRDVTKKGKSKGKNEWNLNSPEAFTIGAPYGAEYLIIKFILYMRLRNSHEPPGFQASELIASQQLPSIPATKSPQQHSSVWFATSHSR